MAGLIAIVGRPNVGKSALFNRIAGRRIAIVHDQPGVTRDRVTAEVEWRGVPFTLIDTGGIGLLRREKSTDVIASAALEQVNMAIESATLILFVVNVQEGLVPLDHDVAQRLRSCGKPVFLIVNKADQEKAAQGRDEFVRLGFKDIYPVSAIHGYGFESMMEAVQEYLPTPSAEETAARDKSERALRLAIVGRPNVGKSSIINALTSSERVIVSPIAGTTRDSVDVPFEVVTEGVSQKYLLIDTAGVRQHKRVGDSVEFFSVKRTEDSIGRSDIVVFVLDAEAGITAQDKKVAGMITERNRACIVVVNKWDLVKEEVEETRKKEMTRRDEKKRDRDGTGVKTMTTLAEFSGWVQDKLFFLDYAPVIFTSAKSGFHLERLLEAVRYVAAQLQQKVPTSILNRTLQDAIEVRQPVSSVGHRLKFYYATQIKQKPPSFLLFVNRDELFADAYTKYLCGVLRKAFGFEGCPIVLVPKARPKTVMSIRKPRPVKVGTEESPKARRTKFLKEKAKVRRQNRPPIQHK